MDKKPWWAVVCGVPRSRTQLSTSTCAGLITPCMWDPHTSGIKPTSPALERALPTTSTREALEPSSFPGNMKLLQGVLEKNSIENEIFPLGHPGAPALTTCLMHPTWTGDLRGMGWGVRGEGVQDGEYM